MMQNNQMLVSKKTTVDTKKNSGKQVKQDNSKKGGKNAQPENKGIFGKIANLVKPNNVDVSKNQKAKVGKKWNVLRTADT